jgi:hypothetical protein
VKFLSVNARREFHPPKFLIKQFRRDYSLPDYLTSE